MAASDWLGHSRSALTKFVCPHSVAGTSLVDRLGSGGSQAEKATGHFVDAVVRLVWGHYLVLKELTARHPWGDFKGGSTCSPEPKAQKSKSAKAQKHSDPDSAKSSRGVVAQSPDWSPSRTLDCWILRVMRPYFRAGSGSIIGRCTAGRQQKIAPHPKRGFRVYHTLFKYNNSMKMRSRLRQKQLVASSSNHGAAIAQEVSAINSKKGL